MPGYIPKGEKMRIIMALFCFICLSYGAFNEDDYLFEALDYEAQNQFEKARDLYLVLYEETKKLEYFKEAIVLSSSLNNPSATLDFANEYIAQGGEKDLTLRKVFLDCYLKLGLSERALEEAKSIAKSEPSPILDDILGSLLASRGEYKEALKYLNRAYNATKNPDIVQKIIVIEIAQSHEKEALRILNSHIESYGCTGSFCKFSIDVYARFAKVDKIEQFFEHIFNENPTIENARNLILIYAYQQKFKQASNIAAQFPFKGQILLDLYVAQKDYLNASLQAKYLYEENQNPYYLALEQIYAFESLENKHNMTKIHSIAEKLKTALNLMQTPDKDTPKDHRLNASLQNFQSSEVGFFLNFLGYLMIDYDIDIKEGVGHVKKALEISPLNPAYLDSLAWGYYKLKDCANAKETFGLIPQNDVKKEQELQEHKNLIDKCAIP